MLLRPLAFCCLMALAACGGGDGLSKADFIEQADQLCLDFNTKASALPEPQSEAELVRWLDDAMALAEVMEKDLDALAPPDDGKKVHQALLTSLRDSTDRVRDARDAAERQDQAGFESAMGDAQEIGQRADTEAKAYGFKVCGSEDELPDT